MDYICISYREVRSEAIQFNNSNNLWIKKSVGNVVSFVRID